MNIQGDMNGSEIKRTGSEPNLIERIENEFRLAVSRIQDGITAERAGIRLGTSGDPDLPILRLKLSGSKPQDSVEVVIPVGRANPDEGIYFAGIQGSEYEPYSSPEEIAQAAVKVYEDE